MDNDDTQKAETQWFLRRKSDAAWLHPVHEKVRVFPAKWRQSVRDSEGGKTAQQSPTVSKESFGFCFVDLNEH